MSDIVLRIEDLGKKYVIRHRAQTIHYVVLRDIIAHNARAIAGRLLETVQGRMAPTTTREEFWALRHIDLEIKQGEVLGVIGRNGAGKSTLLKVLSRITEPTEGRVTITGRVASLLEVGTGFHPELTGRENIFLNGSVLGMQQSEIRRKFDEIVAFAEVEKFLDTPVKRYSSGMYVRLAFAVAAHLEPEILIVDEVLAVGDIAFQKKCLGKMKDVAGSGRTVLFVGHNISAVKTLCHTGIVLKSGEILFRGNSEDAVESYLEHTNAEKSYYVEVGARPRRVSSACRISSVAVRSTSLNTSRFSISEDMIFTVTAQLDEQSAQVGVSVFVLLMDVEEKVVLSSFQKDSDVPYIYGRTSEVSLSFPADIRPDKYMVACGLLSRSGEVIDWIDDVLQLEIMPVFEDGKPFDDRLGIGYVRPRVSYERRAVQEPDTGRT
ncbi:MAG: ATP-binding cassette domain-containing protein [Alphaproteobacteria bacterium]|nr:ATP-binding cassette domain-containing protein [Alphaproteobacteria bacterium]